MSNNDIKTGNETVLAGSYDNDLIGVYSAVLLFVVVASILSIILLCFSYFDVPLIIFGTAVVSFGILRLFSVGIKLPVARLSYTSIFLIALALLLRSDLYPHQMGGQDQGLYVNMAEVLIQNKGLNFQDQFRQELNSEERAVYDQSAMSSVALVDDKQSIYTIEFYPLHPIWMAISKWFFGAGFHTISLLLFSLIGIVGGYHLTKEIFENERAAIIAAFFLSVNPALVFFSKFPVGEIVAFAFSVNGFLFLLRSVKASSSRVRWLYWLIALLSFNCFFFVRMQFFMYLPFFCLLAFVFLVKTNADEQQNKTRLTIVSFVVVLFLTFALSLLFYYAFQRGLFEAMVLGHILSLLNPRFITVAVIGLLALLAVLLSTYATVSGRSRLRGYVNSLVCVGGRLISWLLPVALLASLPSIVNLYKHGQMPPFSFSVPTGDDIWLIRYHVLYRLGLMLSPIGLIILFAVPFFRISWTSKARLFLLFLSTVWLSILLQPWIPYLYYYGRYLVSEMVPYSLVLMSGVLSFLISSRKEIGRMLLFLIGLYFLSFSILQYNKQESDDLDFYNETLRYITKRDVVLASGLDGRQYVPLRVTYGLSVFPLTNRQGELIPVKSETIEKLQVFAEHRGGYLILLNTNLNSQENVKKLAHLTFYDRFLTNGEHIRIGVSFYAKELLSRLFLPVTYKTNKNEYGLYELDKRDIGHLFNNECVSELNLTNAGAIYIQGLTGFSPPESHGRWSDGETASYKCRVPRRGWLPKKAVLEVMAFAPNDHKQIIIASANKGAEVTITLDATNPQQRLEIPLNELISSKELSIELKIPHAKSPKEFGISGDSRKLGISLSKITLE